MTPKVQCSIDCNVHIQIVGTDGKLKSDQRFKNTATQRMTTGIALFLAGDGAAEHRGAWRPNYISFGTVGIRQQPDSATGAALVENGFDDKNPPEGERTRPWFFSTWLGERCPRGQYFPGNPSHPENGCWNPEDGWSTLIHPDRACFQGELVTYNENPDDDTEHLILRRHPILRAEVTNDFPALREAGKEGYGTDCILYGYSSVKWVNSFFNPPHGPSIPRLAISEVGLFEKDSFPASGLKTMMAGFRVPTANDIIYVSPDEVMLVEWRISIRALMPSEGVAVVTEEGPTGISMEATLDAELPNTVDLHAVVADAAKVSQDIYWELVGDYPPGEVSLTLIDKDAKVTLKEGSSVPVIYVRAVSAVDPNFNVKTAIITGLITDIATGIAIIQGQSDEEAGEYYFRADVMGKGEHYDRTVSWALEATDPTQELDPDTTVTQTPGMGCMVHISENETVSEMTLTATSNSDAEIQSVAVILRIDKTAGSYIVSDFSILTE